MAIVDEALKSFTIQVEEKYFQDMEEKEKKGYVWFQEWVSSALLTISISANPGTGFNRLIRIGWLNISMDQIQEILKKSRLCNHSMA